jgi:predicted O-methyltransferase YrrM
MSEERWSAVDRYLEMLLPNDDALAAALCEGETARLPPINVSPLQGQFLHLLTRAIGARRVLELGTLAGFSTICLARALPNDGRLITLEVDPQFAEVARRNLARAQLLDRVEIRLGRAIETLPQLMRENAAPFDLIFIDADKESYADYFPWTVKLSRPGTVIIADNVVRKGDVVDEACDNAQVQGARRFNELVAADSRVTATAIQTVGSKGHDGFLFAVVN